MFCTSGPARLRLELPKLATRVQIPPGALLSFKLQKTILFYGKKDSGKKGTAQKGMV